MDSKQLAYHETLDLHEIINFKTIAIMRAKLMQGVVFSQELKGLMEKAVQQSIKDIEELKPYYEKTTVH